MHNTLLSSGYFPLTPRKKRRSRLTGHSNEQTQKIIEIVVHMCCVVYILHMPHDLSKHNQVKRLFKTYKTKMKREKLITLMASVSNQKWWPHTWTTFKFGCLFSGSELTQQVIIRKIWNDDTREWRSAQDQLPLDWANVGKYRGVIRYGKL